MKKDIRELYKKSVVPSLREQFCLNSESVPKLHKISINRGLGKEVKSQKEIENSLQELALITGQQPAVNKARKSVAGFKVREGMAIGASVTLRRDRMYAFFEKLCHIVIPRMENFRGLSCNNFDKSGNYHLGITDQSIFPEIPYNNSNQLRGLNISIVLKVNQRRIAKLKARYGNRLYPKKENRVHLAACLLGKLGLPLLGWETYMKRD